MALERVLARLRLGGRVEVLHCYPALDRAQRVAYTRALREARRSVCATPPMLIGNPDKSVYTLVARIIIGIDVVTGWWYVYAVVRPR